MIEHRWFSYFHTAQDIVELWSYLSEFLTRYNSKKVNLLKKMIGNADERMVKYVILKAIIELLKPIYEIQTELESGQCISHKVVLVINELNQRLANLELSHNIDSFLQSLPLSGQLEVTSIVKEFCDNLNEKWISTSIRNLNDDTFGLNGLFKKLQVFDPFRKATQVQTFKYFENIFMKVLSETQITVVKHEVTKYLMGVIPDNTNIKALNYWIGCARDYPLLSQNAISYLYMACESIDAERSFSKLRDIQDEKRTRMSEESLKMQMLLYFNGDIEDIFF